MVRAGFYAPSERWKPSTVLLDRAPSGVLGRGAALDDEGGRGWPERRVPQGAVGAACTLLDAIFRRDALYSNRDLLSDPMMVS